MLVYTWYVVFKDSHVNTRVRRYVDVLLIAIRTNIYDIPKIYLSPTFLLMPWTIDPLTKHFFYSRATKLSINWNCPGNWCQRLPSYWNCSDNFVRRLSIKWNCSINRNYMNNWRLLLSKPDYSAIFFCSGGVGVSGSNYYQIWSVLHPMGPVWWEKCSSW